MVTVKRHVKYESELDKSFVHRVMAYPGGEKIRECIQCGTCSAICPLSVWMDYTPRRLIAMVRAGFKDEILNCTTLWLCSSCYACTVVCPRGIHITEIMYALKRIAMEEKRHPRRFPIPVLSNRFQRMVTKRGRINETRLMAQVLWRTNPLRLFSYIPTTLRLLWHGRFTLKPHRIKEPKRLGLVLRKAREVVL